MAGGGATLSAPVPVSWAHQLATIYGQAGVPVFPFRFVANATPDGASKWDKVPLTTHGHLDASPDSAIIGGWARLWADPAAGVGIPMAATGHFALDGDLHGHGDGNAKLAQIRADFGVNVGVGSVGTRTGSGGTHHLLRLMPWFVSTLRRPADWPVGVLDLIYNGWAVAPGSTAPDGSMWLPMLDGAVPSSQEQLVPYIKEWARRVGDRHVELAGPNLLEALRGAAAPTRAECELPGDRTDAENAALRNFGLSVIERAAHELKGRVKNDGRSLIALKACATVAPLIWAGLLEEQWVRGRIDAAQPGLEIEDNCVRNGLDKGNTLARAQLSKIRQRDVMVAAVLAGGGAAGEWGSIRTQGFGPAAVAPAYGTLDASPLPAFKSCPAVAEVVEKGETFGVDPAGAAGVAVCMACNLAAVKFDVCVKKKAVGPHLHMMFVQESGSGKSTMFKALTTRPLDILRYKSVKLQDAADEFSDGYAAFKESVKKSSKGATKVTTGAVLSPRRVFAADTTPQTLASDLSVTQPATIMVTDEASQLYDAASLEHAKPLASLIINTADGTMVERSRMSERKTEGVTAREANRVTGKVEANRTCRFSAIMATQPGTWQSITKGPHGKHFDGRGAPARQLLIAPATNAKLSARASLERADRDGVDAFPLATEALCEMAADFDLMIGRTSPYSQEYWKSQAEKPRGGHRTQLRREALGCEGGGGVGADRWGTVPDAACDQWGGVPVDHPRSYQWGAAGAGLACRWR